jgi:PAS domain S-box-containing protein
MLDGMGEAAFLIGFDWRYLFVNDAAASFCRKRAADMIGSLVMDVHAPLEDRPVLQLYKTSMVDREPRTTEAQWTYPDGTTAWFEIKLQPHFEGLFVRAVNITERKRAIERLRNAEARLGAVVNASPLPCLALDLHGHVILWNRAAERTFGFGSDQVLGQSNPLVPEDQRAGYEGMLRRTLTGEGTQAELVVRVTSDLRRLAVSVSSAPMRGPAGELIGVVEVLTDLTEQNALRTALQESEQRLAGVFDESPVGKLLVRASDRQVVEANRAFLEIFDVKRDELVGHSVATLPLAPAEFDRERFWDVLRNEGRVTDLPVTFSARDGRRKEAVVTAKLISVGGVTYALSVVQDVTLRRTTERALIESDERFRQLSQTIEEVFWLTDLDKQKVIYVSPGYERIWGRPVASLLDDPRSWVNAVHPDDRARVLDAALTKQSLGTYDEVFRIIRPGGEVRWIRDRGFPVRDENGRVFRVAGTAQDVTSERELELQFRQTQKMESIGLLAGGVAHDFNNMLTVIGGNCDSLWENFTQNRESAVLLDEIREAAARAASLTRQLLSFSRREVIEPKVVEVDAIVIDTEKMLRRILGEDITLTLGLCPDKPRIKVDPGSFVQVLMNLAVNARDAMPRGGVLTISTERVILGDEQRRAHPELAPGAFIHLSVKDTGRGIPVDVLPRVFEPFFTTESVGRGTGLGLSVVHGIVAQGGGFIDVESTPGAGTTFHTYIPLVQAEASPRPSRPSVNVAPGTETILFVEDEASIRRIAIRALERLGYTIIEATDGEDAIARAQAHPGPIDLLVTDVVMPRLGGSQVAAALRASYPNMRVLYTSGYTDDAVVQHGVRHAEVAFLPKPYDLVAMRQKIREVLGPARAPR